MPLTDFLPVTAEACTIQIGASFQFESSSTSRRRQTDPGFMSNSLVLSSGFLDTTIILLSISSLPYLDSLIRAGFDLSRLHNLSTIPGRLLCLLYSMSEKFLRYVRFREPAEIAYQLIDIYLDILLIICNAPVSSLDPSVGRSWERRNQDFAQNRCHHRDHLILHKGNDQIL
jgi:hypothetical protein